MINVHSILNGEKKYFKIFCRIWSHKYLLFQLVFSHFKIPINNKVVMPWKTKDWSDESIKLPAILVNSLNSRLDYFNNPKFRVEFNRSCLKLDKITFSHNKK